MTRSLADEAHQEQVEGSDVFLPRQLQDFLYGNYSFNGEPLMHLQCKKNQERENKLACRYNKQIQQQQDVKFIEPVYHKPIRNSIKNKKRRSFARDESLSSVAATISTASTSGTSDSVAPRDATGKRSILKVKTHDESKRQVIVLKTTHFPRQRQQVVGFDQVKVHSYSLALAGQELIPIHFRFSLSPPYMTMGEWLESDELSVDDYEQQVLKKGIRHWGGNHRHDGSNKIKPLRIYARERLLQKAGVSLKAIQASKVEFDRERTKVELTNKDTKHLVRYKHGFHGAEFKLVPREQPDYKKGRHHKKKKQVASNKKKDDSSKQKSRRWRDYFSRSMTNTTS